MFLICAVCRTRLTVVEQPGHPDTYTHSVEGRIDHEPAPVPEAVLEGNLHCDFCFGPPAALLPLDPAALALASDATDTIDLERAAWTACHPSTELVEHGDYSRLIERVITAISLRHGPLTAAQRDQLRTSLSPLYERFRLSRTGPPQPIP